MLHRHLSPECAAFICAMLESDREERPSAAQLLLHPFITGYQCAQCSSPCSVLPAAVADAAAYVTVLSSGSPLKKGGLDTRLEPRAEKGLGLDTRLESRDDSRGVESHRGASVSSTVAMSPEGSSRPVDSPPPLERGGRRQTRTLSEQGQRKRPLQEIEPAQCSTPRAAAVGPAATPQLVTPPPPPPPRMSRMTSHSSFASVTFYNSEAEATPAAELIRARHREVPPLPPFPGALPTVIINTLF